MFAGDFYTQSYLASFLCAKGNMFAAAKTAVLKPLLSLLLLMICFCRLPAKAQTDSSIAPHIRISLVTCGPGAEIYSVFGHTAVRIIDSVRGTDIVYNYGTFNGFDQDFELKFMKGKLLYYLSTETFANFIEVYGSGGRRVQEQEILLPGNQKYRIQQYLEENMLPENRAYHYDFFFDNCATRIRDIFQSSLGSGLQYPNVLPQGKALSFRTIINRYLQYVPWERMGINILLGSKIDRTMSSPEIMFLPDYLRDGFAGAMIDHSPLSAPVQQLLPAGKMTTAYCNPVVLTMWIMALLTMLGLSVPSLRSLGAVMSTILLILTGLLGLLILVMWFGTDHKACSANFNLLWALPTNLVFIFRKHQYKYAAIASIFLLLSLLLHISGIQCLLLPEMTPLLLALLFIFTNAYRQGRLSAKHGKSRTP